MTQDQLELCHEALLLLFGHKTDVLSEISRMRELPPDVRREAMRMINAQRTKVNDAIEAVLQEMQP